MSNIKIVYIDDNSDEILSRYIKLEYCNVPYSKALNGQVIAKDFDEIRFNATEGYESLLHDSRIRSANVILIDNHLFEERTAGTGKFSGKQFKVILRKLFPYIEVVIITQDELLMGDNIVHKFSKRHGENPNQYYEQTLAPVLNRALNEVIEFENLAEDLRQSADVEKLLIDKILLSLQGDDSYDALTKADIDDLVKCFKELKDSYDE